MIPVWAKLAAEGALLYFLEKKKQKDAQASQNAPGSSKATTTTQSTGPGQTQLPQPPAQPSGDGGVHWSQEPAPSDEAFCIANGGSWDKTKQICIYTGPQYGGGGGGSSIGPDAPAPTDGGSAIQAPPSGNPIGIRGPGVPGPDVPPANPPLGPYSQVGASRP
jgi:hypothetical protein